MEKNNEKIEKKNKSKEAVRIILLIIAIIVLICSTVYIGYYIYNQYAAEKEYEDLTTVSVATTENLVANPIDFNSLKAQNDDIYAWIKVDDTEVDYPIVQSKNDDEFYLKHSALDKKWLDSGAIYTQSCNSTDFSDPVTLIYGHNGYKQTMFTTLHKFEKEDFFNSNEYFYIYTPGRKLTYQVVSAFKYDDRHIMNSFDFSDEKSLKEFQDIVTNPNSTLKNVRTDLDVPIDKNSRIVVLSTCITGQRSNRFLVCGVLVKDEKTK